MLEKIIYYQIYIIIGILIFPIFAFLVYFTKSLIDRIRFIKTLHNMKKPLMEKINNAEEIYKEREEENDISTIIFDIKNDIDILKNEINITQKTNNEIKKLQELDQDIDILYKNIGYTQTEPTKKETAEGIYKNAVLQQQDQNSRIYKQETQMQKQQVKIMNENINKFIFVYKEKELLLNEKEKALAEKNKSIHILQQELNEAQKRITCLLQQEKRDTDKDNLIATNTKIIATLEQKTQKTEEKYKKMIMLYNETARKEKEANLYLEEKNKFIQDLQSKIEGIEKKLQEMIYLQENSKDKILERKIGVIDKKIKLERKKNRIFMITGILAFGIGTLGFMFLYMNYMRFF